MDQTQLRHRLQTEAAALAPRWTVSVEITRPAGEHLINIELQHPASHGLVFIVEATHSDPHQWLRRVIEESDEIAIIKAAPGLEHAQLILGLRSLIQAFHWTAVEVRGMAFLLHGTGALTADEAAWLAGYCPATDAPMAPQPPV